MRPIIVGTMIFSMTVLPVTAGFAADTPTEKVKLQNVELNSAGKAAGRLVDAKGKPIAGQQIEIRTAKEIQKKTTAADGSFVVESAHGGNCAIIVKDKAFACRLWKKNTAPPRSLRSFGIVYSKGPIVRAQNDDDDEGGMFGQLGGVSGQQLLGLGLLGGAITAIVLAVENDDDGS